MKADQLAWFVLQHELSTPQDRGRALKLATMSLVDAALELLVRSHRPDELAAELVEFHKLVEDRFPKVVTDVHRPGGTSMLSSVFLSSVGARRPAGGGT